MSQSQFLNMKHTNPITLLDKPEKFQWQGQMNAITHHQDKFIETTNPQLQGSQCTNEPFEISSRSKESNQDLKDFFLNSYKTQGEISDNVDELFIKLENHEHPIYMGNPELFQASLKSAVNCHQIQKQKQLGMKIVLLQNYSRGNSKMRGLLIATLEEYSKVKYEKIEEVRWQD